MASLAAASGNVEQKLSLACTVSVKNKNLMLKRRGRVFTDVN
jgi:hypothetical protein